MFTCAKCKTVVPPRTSGVRVTMETRPKSYPRRPKANVRINPTPPRRVLVDDPGGEGREIVREALLCVACAKAS